MQLQSFLEEYFAEQGGADSGGLKRRPRLVRFIGGRFEVVWEGWSKLMPFTEAYTEFLAEDPSNMLLRNALELLRSMFMLAGGASRSILWHQVGQVARRLF